jgi:putative PIN family toxin of toxin-antitoxin system
VLRAVADTNIVVSALLWRGTPHQLFSLTESGEIAFYTSRALIEELADVLPRRKLARAVRATGKSVQQLVSEYAAIAQLVQPRALPAPVIARDPDDDQVLSCALGARAQLIVSGDKDVRDLRAYRRIRIVDPAQALAIVRARR